MGSSLACFSFIFFIIIFPCLGASQDDCRLQRCSKKSPAIKFPFRLKGRQPDYCGYPIHGFELSCNARKQTVIELPDAGQFFVRRIDYKSQELDLYASDSCLLNRFLHLNFSPSPFHYRCDYVYNRTFFNCPLRQETTWKLITCLSVPGYQVYAVYSELDVSELPLSSCIKLNTALVPNELLYSKSDVGLNWSAPTCGACEENGKKYCRLKGRNGPETECYDIAKPKGSSTKRVITGATIGFFLLVVAVGTAVYCFCYSNKVERENQIKIERFLEDYKALKPTRYSYADMKRMTDQFKNKLGQGGYGTVFKGKLSNEILVAVKILNNSTGNGEEFINEVGTMSRIHHVNVVRLVGFCADGFKRAVVYEFQPNESLEKFIFSKDSKNPSLGWKKLQDIALGIAKGIEYLHQGCDQRILHFDIKPHNILLDHNFNPKISDFGLAKLCSKEQSAVSMTAARGTMGYIAPEVFSRNFGNVSYKSDVFSFGMMLLEMVGGRKNIDTTVENTSQVYFPEWIYNRLDQGEELGIQVNEEDDAKIAKKLTIVALWCIQWYPVDRPSMKVVVQMLEGDGESLDIPPNPFASMDQPTTSVAMAGRPFHNELTVISEAE